MAKSRDSKITKKTTKKAAKKAAKKVVKKTTKKAAKKTTKKVAEKAENKRAVKVSKDAHYLFQPGRPKTGGRQKGTPNKTTVERIANELVARASLETLSIAHSPRNAKLYEQGMNNVFTRASNGNAVYMRLAKELRDGSLELFERVRYADEMYADLQEIFTLRVGTWERIVVAHLQKCRKWAGHGAIALAVYEEKFVQYSSEIKDAIKFALEHRKVELVRNNTVTTQQFHFLMGGVFRVLHDNLQTEERVPILGELFDALKAFLEPKMPHIVGFLDSTDLTDKLLDGSGDNKAKKEA